MRKELSDLLKSEAELARRVDMLKFQIEEIRSAKLKPNEDDELTIEQKRLANAETLAALSDDAYTSLYEGDGETPAALDALAKAQKALAGLAKIDPQFAAHLGTIDSVTAQIDDLAHEVRRYREAIEYSPKRLNAVEDRLDLIKRLKRKYGATLPDVIAFAERAEKELGTLEHSGERIAELREEEDKLLHEIGRAGKNLSATRKVAAEKLAAGIEAELNDLRMAGAHFAVDLKWEAAENGAYANGQRVAFDATGLDRVEFLVAPNIGEGLEAAGQDRVRRRDRAPDVGVEDRALPRRSNSDVDLRRDRSGHRRARGFDGGAEAAGASARIIRWCASRICRSWRVTATRTSRWRKSATVNVPSRT